MSPIARLKQKYRKIHPERDAYSCSGHMLFYWTYARPVLLRLDRYALRLHTIRNRLD